jgi:hypothetical protein
VAKANLEVPQSQSPTVSVDEVARLIHSKLGTVEAARRFIKQHDIPIVARVGRGGTVIVLREHVLQAMGVRS